MNLLVLGPQGSGKGTQAKRISAAHGIPHVSTGDMFRAAVAAGTELGLRVEPILVSGDLVPDDLTVALIRERLSEQDARDGFVLDGFPRNLAQAEALDGMLDGLGRRIAAVVVFDIELEEVVRRLSGRRVCRAAEHVYHVEFHPPKDEGVCDEDGSELYQRDDDREDVVRARYEKQWLEAAAPVLQYYSSHGLVQRIDASRPKDVVAREVDELIDGAGGGR